MNLKTPAVNICRYCNFNLFDVIFEISQADNKNMSRGGDYNVIDRCILYKYQCLREEVTKFSSQILNISSFIVL